MDKEKQVDLFLTTEQDIDSHIAFLHTEDGQELIEQYFEKLGGHNSNDS